MKRFIRIWLWLLAAACTLAAAEVVPARADEPATVVWYRAGEGCPGAPVFIAKVNEKSAGARLATGGEHIDFVVTLVSNEGETIGRLERQTQAGTVAIRQLKDASCERVANALALSLALAMAPSRAGGTDAPVTDAGTDLGSDAAPPEPASESSESSATAAESSVAPRAPQVAPPALAPSASAPALSADPLIDKRSVPRTRHWLGVQGGAELGILPAALVRARAYFELAPPDDMPLRFGVLGRLGSASTAVGPVKRWVLAADLGACPVLFDPHLVPCAGLELGATGASDSRPTSRSESRPWLAPSLALRASFEPARRLRLELEAGSSAPLLRSDLYAGDVRVYQEKPFTFHVDIGVAADLW